jgi:hypothetical protein
MLEVAELPQRWTWNQRKPDAVNEHERFIKLAPQSAFTRPAIQQSQAA